MTSEHVRLSEELARAVNEVRRNPRAMVTKARRLVDVLRARVLFHGCSLGFGVAAGGLVRVRNQGTLNVDDRVTFLGGMVPTELSCAEGARMVIGAEAVINYGVSIDARQAIEIGPRSMLASFVHISDSGRDRVAPVRLGSDVWVAHGAIIEAGVTIGDGSVVSAGSVVTRDIPPNMLAIGNPARPMSLDLVA